MWPKQRPLKEGPTESKIGDWQGSPHLLTSHSFPLPPTMGWEMAPTAMLWHKTALHHPGPCPAVLPPPLLSCVWYEHLLPTLSAIFYQVLQAAPALISVLSLQFQPWPSVMPGCYGSLGRRLRQSNPAKPARDIHPQSVEACEKRPCFVLCFSGMLAISLYIASNTFKGSCFP